MYVTRKVTKTEYVTLPSGVDKLYAVLIICVGTPTVLKGVFNTEKDASFFRRALLDHYKLSPWKVSVLKLDPWEVKLHENCA